MEVASAADGLVDATYVRDPGLVTGAGAVQFQMAKPGRVAEPPLLATALAAAGVPVAAQLTGAARADGGDFIWLDERTMLAGRSYRTNAEALSQLAQILSRVHAMGMGFGMVQEAATEQIQQAQRVPRSAQQLNASVAKALEHTMGTGDVAHQLLEMARRLREVDA